MEPGLSPAELRVLQSLQSRRGELDEREQALATQLAVLQAPEGKVDGKLKAPNDPKDQIQKLLVQEDEKEAQETNRLVIVYSAMKPAQAAAIMTQLDDKVRIPVAGKMKERTLAAILAQMPAAEAKKLTEKLANRYASSEVMAQKASDIAAGKAPATPPVAKASAPAADKPRVRRSPSRAPAKVAAAKAPAPKPVQAAATEKPAAKPAEKPAAPKPTGAGPQA